MDIEIPLGKRTKKYRFFEMLPGMLSYGAIILLIILSMVNPVLASIYLLTVILVAFVKAMAISDAQTKDQQPNQGQHDEPAAPMDFRKV